MSQSNLSGNSMISYAVKNSTKPIKSFGKATNLHIATELNMLDEIKATIKNNPEFLYVCEHEWLATPIEIAIIYGNFDAALLLCDMVPSLPSHLICEMTYRLLSLRTASSLEDNVKLLGFLWKQTNPTFNSIIQICGKPLVHFYLRNMFYDYNDWHTCLKLMFTSSIAQEIMDEYVDYKKKNIYGTLLSEFHERKTEKIRRIELIKLWISLGVRSSLSDIAEALIFYGINDEVKLLALALESNYSNNYNNNNVEYLASIICGVDDKVDYDRLFVEKIYCERYFKLVSKYFTKPTPKNVISLQEISRNSIRELIKRCSGGVHPVNYFYAANNLPLPQIFIDFILFNRML